MAWTAARLVAVPIHDNHFHCRRDGWKGLRAAEEFQRAGGTSIAHVRLPTYPTTVASFVQSVRDHLAFGDVIRAQTGLKVWSAVGPYPLEPMKVAEAAGWPAAIDFGQACLDACRPFFEDGAAHCLGEVGRAHFPVAPEVQENLNGLLGHAMVVAKESRVPIMLHTEHTEPETMAEFATMADRAGLARGRVIKHYCGPLVAEGEHAGLVPSIIAGRSNLRTALAKDPGGRWMLETDYIDEPSRPDVVMPCTTVPKRVLGLMANGEMPERTAWSIGKEWPERLYGA